MNSKTIVCLTTEEREPNVNESLPFLKAFSELFMTKIGGKNNVGIEDLFCPITLELFRDPVTAKDGHIYEREAITRWILEKGTSPFTREPLQINDLQPDHRLKSLAEKHRNKNEKWKNFGRCCHCPERPKNVNPRVKNDPATNNIRNMFITIICLLIFPMVFTLALIFGINNSYPADIYITSNYSGSFTLNSPTYSLYSTPYSYEKTQVILSNNGFYGFEINREYSIYGYNDWTTDLYKNSFNSSNATLNLMEYKYGSGPALTNSFGVLLQPDKYILVITSRYPSTNVISVSVTGPASVTFS